MAGNRRIPKLEDITFNALVTQGIFSIETTMNMDPRKVSRFIEEKIHAKLMPIFLQAVIDDNRKKVAELLTKNPELLLIRAQKGCDIQSPYTWVTFDVENEDALSIAAKRKQIKMIELLLPYYDKLEQTVEVIKAKADSLSVWKSYQIQKNAEGKDEISIPQPYLHYAQSWIDVFQRETFPHGVKGKLSEKTEDLPNLLLSILSPSKPTKLDDYIEPELLLLALYETYCKQFKTFKNWEQRDAFCIRMMGLTQSVLTPETAKIFCEGIHFVLEKQRKINECAESLTLHGGKSFYRTSRLPLSGMGIDYLCGADGRPHFAAGSDQSLLKNYLEQKQQFFGTLTQQWLSTKPAYCRS